MFIFHDSTSFFSTPRIWKRIQLSGPIKSGSLVSFVTTGRVDFGGMNSGGMFDTGVLLSLKPLLAHQQHHLYTRANTSSCSVRYHVCLMKLLVNATLSVG